MKHYVDRFLQKHKIRILDANKRAHRLTRQNIKFFSYPDDLDVVEKGRDISLETEPLYTLEICESELDWIANLEWRVVEQAKHQYGERLVDDLFEQKRQEQHLRDRHPAVKKAFEQYSMILSMASNGELDGH